MAMDRALSLLGDAERALDECASCLVRDVIVSDAQALDHNRSIVAAKAAIGVLKDGLSIERMRKFVDTFSKLNYASCKPSL